MLTELKESLPSFFRQSAAYRELEQQAAERVEQQRIEALEQLAGCDVRHSATIPPLEDAIEAAAADVKTAEQLLFDARRKLSAAMQARQSAQYPIDRDVTRLTNLLEGELCPQQITNAVAEVDADCQRLLKFSPSNERSESAVAKCRAVADRLQSLRAIRGSLLALRTQPVDDLNKSIRKLWASVPEA